MFSRLTAIAALFAIVTTTSLAYAATAVHKHRSAPAAQVIVLERVVVTGTHTPASN
jgi:hypothetical protein